MRPGDLIALDENGHARIAKQDEKHVGECIRVNSDGKALIKLNDGGNAWFRPPKSAVDAMRDAVAYDGVWPPYCDYCTTKKSALDNNDNVVMLNGKFCCLDCFAIVPSSSSS